MNKKIFAIAMVALATVGGSSAFAARQDKKQDCTPDCPQKECTLDAKKCDKKDCKAQRPSPFDGLNLTADQQTKLDQLRDDARKEQQAIRQQAQADRQKAREDGKAFAEKARKDYLAKVKEILSPEQYVQFLENAYVNNAPHAKGAQLRNGKMRPAKDGAKIKGDRKGQRPDGKPGKSADKAEKSGK